MTRITDTLRTCHATVWQYRAELESVLIPVPRDHAILFALTELGEAADAELRTMPQYARNHSKDLNMLDELADFAFDLLTAMGPEPRVTDIGVGTMTHTWQEYVTGIAGVMQMTPGSAWADYNLTQLLARIATHPGMDLPTRLTARLERIRAKRLGVTT